MKNNCTTCIYCRDGICRDEACAGCFDDPEHRNYEPRLKQIDSCVDYDLTYCEGRDCSECPYLERRLRDENRTNIKR